ncbi:MAG: Inner rane protein translocase component YidC, long form [Myxococcaceae bacterium]|nr:Inner rane protein translocase component YidC, long form [Myxococcaceae bacterium]
MDRSTLLRWVVIAAGILLFWKFGMPLITGKNGSAPQPVAEEKYVNAPDFAPDILDQGADKPPPEGELCTIKGNRFEAELSTRGAAVRHFHLKDHYAKTPAADMSTTPDHERWRSLRTMFRGEGANDQLDFDRFNWKLEKLGETGCKFSYSDPKVEITKTVTAGKREFEVEVETTVKNLSDAPKKHRFSVETFAFRTNAEVSGHLGRVSPFLSELVCARGKDVERKAKDDSHFKDHGWFTEPGVDRFAAVSNYYFAQALVPEGEPADCRVLAEDWYSAGQARDADNAGAVYHAQLAYAPRELVPQATATYKQLAFFGPKERDVLVHAGADRGLGDLINLGFFSPVAKYLVRFLQWFHDHVTGNWGLAIIAMTICLRLALFPLTWKSIKSTISMRRLKPEVDALNAKFADDAQAKNMAMMELWRKNGVNPLGGCLPQLIQMPIWFAMYTTLQTAVEMYHEPFAWFTDLSAPDKFYVLPIVLGVFMILQQRIVPQQGMDPVQQKMMMYLLPGVFTVMMLFLPAALGVYMLTNSVLGIAQQLAVEQLAPRTGPGGPGEIVVKQVATSKNGDLEANGVKQLGKGKARV